MIPASVLIIAVPIVAAAPAYVLRRWRLVEALIATLACGLVIALLARPVESVLTIGGLTIDVRTPVNVLGRTLAVRSYDQLPLLLLFATAAILFMIGWAVSESWTYVPVGLGILALLAAGLLIRPFVFAGLAFVAAAALGAIMAQAERSGKTSTAGALRYLVVSTLALPAFLGAGYVVSQASLLSDITAQTAAYGPAVTLLVIGLGLIFGAFPIFTWTHSVSKESPPMAAAFLATVSSGAVCFLFLSLLQDFTWFRDSAEVVTFMKVLGIATLVFGGLLGWAQRSFGRVIACGISVEIGSMLILLSHITALSVETVAFDLLARALSLGLLGLGVALMQRDADVGSDEFERLTGLGRRHRWAALAIAAGGLSLAGIPGTAGFVARWATARTIGQSDLELLVVTLLASASIGIGIIRGLAALFAPAPAEPSPVQPADQRTQQRTQRAIAITVVAAVVLIVVLGVAPGITEPVTRVIAQNYTFYR